jgi:hypothetical protein
MGTELISKPQLDTFFQELSDCFPNMVAGCISDRHGFPVASKINQNKQLDEELLAVSAISDRELLDLSDYHKVVRSLDANVKLIVLLEKSWKNLYRFKLFDQIVELHNPV